MSRFFSNNWRKETGDAVSKVTKSFWRKKKEYKLFGLKVFEIDENCSAYDGDGEFISESVPNKAYFEREFLSNKKGES